jgi:FlaA1/EpsC-like NDP-sugar epimerase
MATRIHQVRPTPRSLNFGPATPFSKYSGEQRLRQACYVVTDLSAIWFSASIALYLRFASGLFRAPRPGTVSTLNMGEHVGIVLLYSGLIVLFCNTQRIYSGVLANSGRDESWCIGKAIGLATALQLGCIYLSRLNLISSFVIVVTMVGSFLSMVTWRRLYGLQLQTGSGVNCRNVLIVGQGYQAQALHDELKRDPQFGCVLKGILGPLEERLRDPETGTTLGSIANLQAVVRGNFIDEIIVCHPDREIVKRVADEGQKCGLGVHIIPDLYDGLAWGAPVEYRGRFPGL